MEVLGVLAIIATLWSAIFSLYRWLQRQRPALPVKRQPRAQDFLLPPKPDPEEEHLRFIARYSRQVIRSKYGQGR